MAEGEQKFKARLTRETCMDKMFYILLQKNLFSPSDTDAVGEFIRNSSVRDNNDMRMENEMVML